MSYLSYTLCLLVLPILQKIHALVPTDEEEELKALLASDVFTTLYVGDQERYTTELFYYDNYRAYFMEDESLGDYYSFARTELRCTAQYLKCIGNLEVYSKVCGYNRYLDYRNFGQYCHVYLDNCFNNHRHLRINQQGGCGISAIYGYAYMVYKQPELKHRMKNEEG
ncbi:uncharacterized protein LOC142983675 [Anticarsia gemmatalis]|uniref:uncharacterized protein LOC142983675 n=1 Tax=Anticarsia gemmatalis TaxID=129554 RepID=UPI003F75FC03